MPKLPDVWLTTDTHFNHAAMTEKEHRPIGYEQFIIKRWKELVKPADLIFHLGDVIMSRQSEMEKIIRDLPGRKILILGNHDKNRPMWYMQRGFDFACYGTEYRHAYLTHEPSQFLPTGCIVNIHGHLHSDGHRETEVTINPWNKKLAIEETNYSPILFSDFMESCA